MKYMAPVSLMVVALVAFALSGCGTKPKEQADSGTPAADGEHADGEHADHDHGDHDHGDHADHGDSGKTAMEKMKEELAKLSPEDAASAMKQHMCPVTDDMLGVMGPPQKIEVKGRQVWICCDDCKDTILDDPDKYLAKLPKE